MRELQEYYPEIRIKEQNHDRDHVHLLVIIPPKYSVGKVVGLIKANSSRAMKEKFEFLKKCYYGTDGVWSDGYLVSTVGLEENMIRRYIEKQGQEDSGQTLFG
jgi:putative transposase